MSVPTYKEQGGLVRPTYPTKPYAQFLAEKVKIEKPQGFDVDLSEIHPKLYPHQKLAVQWAVRGGMNCPYCGKHRFDVEDLCGKATADDRGFGNDHPTVKPHELMRWLVRLVTPLGGICLDPFTGSGSTGKACHREGFAFIGIEKSQHFCEIARKRIYSVTPPLEAF